MPTTGTTDTYGEITLPCIDEGFVLPLDRLDLLIQPTLGLGMSKDNFGYSFIMTG